MSTPTDASTTEHPPAHHRRIRSFVRREGRLTPAQSRALDALLPRYGAAVAAFAQPTSLFERVAPITIEIGFGDGDNLLAACQAHPERNYIGFEVHRPGVGRLLDRADKAGVTNLRVCSEDAAETLAGSAAEPWIDQAFVLFPDPWHKARHHKRRLIQPAFLDMLAQRMAQGAQLRLATDWADYAEHMAEVCEAHPAFVNAQGPGGQMPEAGDRIETKFERRGLRLGHTIADFDYRRV